MSEIEIVSRFDNTVLLKGNYSSIKDCLEKNRGVNLGGANLGGAELRGVENYYRSHDFAIELIRCQDIKFFSDEEWATIGKITTHRLCWGEITKNYKSALTIFEKLAKIGWDEYEKKFQGKL